MKSKIIDEKPLALFEVKEVLERSKEQGELNFRAAKTYDYLTNTTILEEKKARKLIKELVALDVARLKDKHIAKLIDCLPRTEEDVKFVLQAFTLTVSPADRKRIAEVMAKHT